MQKQPDTADMKQQPLRSTHAQAALDDRLCAALVTMNAQEVAYALEAGANANTKRLVHQFPKEGHANYKQSPLHFTATYMPEEGYSLNPQVFAIIDMLWMAGAEFSKAELKTLSQMMKKSVDDTRYKDTLETYTKAIGMRYLHSLECGQVKPDSVALEENYGIRFDSEKQRIALMSCPTPSSAVTSIGRELDKNVPEETPPLGCAVFMETMIPLAEREKRDWIHRAYSVKQEQKRQQTLN